MLSIRWEGCRMRRQVLGPEIKPLETLSLGNSRDETAYLKRLVLRTTEQCIEACGIYHAKDIPNVMIRMD
jgi:hypothetical protein